MDDLEIAAKFDKIEKDICVLQGSSTDTRVWQAKYGEKIDNLSSGLTQLMLTVKEIADKPKRRWETVISTVIIAVVTGVIGYVLAFAK